MAEEQTLNAVTGSTGRSPLLFILSVILVVGVGGFTGFLWTSKGDIAAKNKALDSEIVAVQADIEDLKSQRLSAALQAQEWLKQIEENEIKWSNVITRLNSTVPFDGKTGKEKAIFTSYSGGTDGKITLSTQTRPVKYNPFLDVAEIIEVFNESSAFVDAYIPSVSKFANEEGDEAANFVLSMDYVKPDLSAISEVSEDSEEVDEVKVSR